MHQEELDLLQKRGQLPAQLGGQKQSHGTDDFDLEAPRPAARFEVVEDDTARVQLSSQDQHFRFTGAELQLQQLHPITALDRNDREPSRAGLLDPGGCFVAMFTHLGKDGRWDNKAGGGPLQ